MKVIGAVNFDLCFNYNFKFYFVSIITDVSLINFDYTLELNAVIIFFMIDVDVTFHLVYINTLIYLDFSMLAFFLK